MTREEALEAADANADRAEQYIDASWDRDAHDGDAATRALYASLAIAAATLAVFWQARADSLPIETEVKVR